RVARTEPTLRDMLQQFRQLFDMAVFDTPIADCGLRIADSEPPASRMPPDEGPKVKSFIELETPAEPPEALPSNPQSANRNPQSLGELWEQEVRSARRKLEPEGALTGATRELQAGLGTFLQTCHEQGVKVGPWRLQHVVGEWTFGDHPTYGALTLAHWACKD